VPFLELTKCGASLELSKTWQLGPKNYLEMTRTTVSVYIPMHCLATLGARCKLSKELNAVRPLSGYGYRNCRISR